MKRLGSGFTATLLLLCSHASLAGDKKPAPAAPQQPAAAAAAAPPEKLSPEEAKKRKDWAFSMHKKPQPKKGCFTASYPDAEWKEVACATAPNLLFMPRPAGPPAFTIGNGNDILAQAPSGTITQAIGHFESPTNVTSESGMINNTGSPVANAYSLQLNTNFMTSTAACAGAANPATCQGWEQWVFYNNGSAGVVFIQYWLIGYNKACTAPWTTVAGGYCVQNSSSVNVPNQPITNIASWTFSGTATGAGDSYSMGTGTNVYSGTGANAVAASANWTVTEFNIFGPAGGSQANLNNGASIDARTEIIYGGTAAPNCLVGGTTGETNNLSFGPTAPAATAPGPAVIFQESTAGGAASNCAAAATIGDTHLRTFNNLLYDFQAAGDFTLAEVAPGFEVQTRQVSGAPTWPNATVNKAIAARLGKTQVAICGGAEPRVFVDGKLMPVEDGKILDLGGGAAMRRQGNLYDLVGPEGNSVHAETNSYNGTYWINVNVGLGKWPTEAKGLIANVKGNVNQIAARDGFVLTNPFNFDELYHRFADSWRVAAAASMLSACNAERAIEVGTPKQAFYAKDLEEAVREKARGVCATAGVKPGPLLDACILDVAVIGQDAAAKVFVDFPPPVAVGTLTGGEPPPAPSIFQQWWWLILLLVLFFVYVAWLLIRKKP
jgi:hypothetical protein